MKSVWKRLWLVFVGVFTIIGISSTSDSAIQNPTQQSTIKATQITEITPLYLTHANNLFSDSSEVMTAWHYSHSSHYSHYSSRY